MVSELSRLQYSADVEEERGNGEGGGTRKHCGWKSTCYGDMRQTEESTKPQDIGDVSPMLCLLKNMSTK